MSVRRNEPMVMESTTARTDKVGSLSSRKQDICSGAPAETKKPDHEGRAFRFMGA